MFLELGSYILHFLVPYSMAASSFTYVELVTNILDLQGESCPIWLGRVFLSHGTSLLIE
jgi:hypothetical protein